MSAGNDRLAHSVMYQQVVAKYREVYTDFALAKGEFTKQKAKFKLIEKSHAEGKVSDAELETRAHADDRIADLYQAYLNAEAMERSYKEKLWELKEASASWRMEAARERDLDRLHAEGVGGGA